MWLLLFLYCLKMRVLFFGDIVGEQAVDQLVTDIPRWRQEHSIDLVIANMENAIVSHPEDLWGGFGISLDVITRLTEAGVDVLTGGNHSWDAPHTDAVMAYPKIVRPGNVTNDLPGRGHITLEVNGELVTVVNLIGDTAAGKRYHTQRPFDHFQAQTFSENSLIIIDYHANTPIEKWSLARVLDGQVMAIMGTHTHEPTLNLYRLPQKTFFVTDVGMNGPTGGVLGMGNRYFLSKENQPDAPVDFDLAPGPLQLGAVIFDNQSGEIVRLCDRNWPGDLL